MIQDHISRIADEIALKPAAVRATVSLLKQEATIPFIARYRKEATGNLNEVAITAIRDRLSQLEELDARKATVLKSLETHGHLTDELKQKVISAEDIASLEDIYLPYRPKRRTKAMIAREKGLEPLALKILEQTELSDSFVKDPADCVSVQQKVNVRVIAVDLERKRISLSMKTGPDASTGEAQPKKAIRRHVETKSKKKKTRNTAFHNPFEEALKKKR